MAPEETLLPCPFCQGRGHMSRSEIVSRLEDPELPDKIVAELNRSAGAKEEVPVGAGGDQSAQPRDFATQVHGWNKSVLWRRSPKE